MASNPLAQCCTIGVKHEGEAQGEIGKIGECVLAYPKDRSTTNTILIITDVIGHKAINAQLIADQFAANGYFTVMPDLFHGDPVPMNLLKGFDLPQFISKHGTGSIDPIITNTINELRSKYGASTVGGVGYCFEATYVCRFLKDGKLDARYCAHPSFVEKEELEAIPGPLSISAAETDHIFPSEKRHESEIILEGTGQPYQIFLFSGVEHGFAVRWEMSNSNVKRAKEQAFIQAVMWFDEFLKKPTLHYLADMALGLSHGRGASSRCK